jgi:hypothetical protein
VAYAEFYTDSTGSNINAGDNKTVVTSTNGGWSTVTNIFTAASGTPFSGVSAGDFASIYTDGATTTVCVARVTAVGGGGATLTLSTTSRIGTAPTTAASGITCTVGGKWLGPNGTDLWPFDKITSALVNTTGNLPRVNMKNTSTYSITSAITHSQTGVTFQGYTTTVGDGGKFTLDSGTSAIVPLTLSGRTALYDFIIQGSGGGAASGTNAGIVPSSARSIIFRGAINTVRGAGIAPTAPCMIAEVETYSCNKAATAHVGGCYDNSAGCTWLRCISHDNTGTSVDGFVINGVLTTFIDCIADTNGGSGWYNTSNHLMICINCDAYNNTSDGFHGGSIPYYFENCNAVKNGAYGFNFADASGGFGLLVNCAVGTGTQVNTSGATNIIAGAAVQIIGNSGSVTSYASNVTPWIDPANGDFRINLAAAIAVGRGSFTQTAASYAGASASPVIGACQVADYPTVGNVNSGTTYANAAYTGTLSAGGHIRSREFIN